MTQLLIINSSPKIKNSQTRILMGFFIEQWHKINPGAEMIFRDIGQNPPSHITETMINAYFTAPDDRNEQQQSAIAFSDLLVDELISADVVVIGSPMHNFSITSGLKAYIDHIARVGRTFKHTKNGKVGLLANKKVFVISARGSDFSSEGSNTALNFQDPYLKATLALIGLDQVTFINAEGVAKSPQGVLDAKNSILASIKR